MRVQWPATHRRTAPAGGSTPIGGRGTGSRRPARPGPHTIARLVRVRSHPPAGPASGRRGGPRPRAPRARAAQWRLTPTPRGGGRSTTTMRRAPGDQRTPRGEVAAPRTDRRTGRRAESAPDPGCGRGNPSHVLHTDLTFRRVARCTEAQSALPRRGEGVVCAGDEPRTRARNAGAPGRRCRFRAAPTDYLVHPGWGRQRTRRAESGPRLTAFGGTIGGKQNMCSDSTGMAARRIRTATRHGCDARNAGPILVSRHEGAEGP